MDPRKTPSPERPEKLATRAQTNFTFVHTGDKKFDQNAKTIARSHAASWSRGQARKRFLPHRLSPSSTNNPLKVKTEETDTDTTIARPQRSGERGIRRRSIDLSHWSSSSASDWGRPDSTDASETPVASRASSAPRMPIDISVGTELDSFHLLPQFPIEQRHPGALDDIKRHMFRLMGVDFVGEGLIHFGSRYPAVFDALLLIAYAHQLALSRRTLSPEILELKGRLILLLDTQLSRTDAAEVMITLIIMIALGSPVVCLASAELPNPTPIATWPGDSPPENSAYEIYAAAIAESAALKDHFIHRDATITLIQRNRLLHTLRESRLGREILVMEILEDAYKTATNPGFIPVFTKEHLYPSSATAFLENITPLLSWRSPFYCPQGSFAFARPPRTNSERSMVALALNVQSWLATFEAPVGDETIDEGMRLHDRIRYRKTIEGFPPVSHRPLFESDYMYECCRLVAALLLRAEALGSTLRDAVMVSKFPTQLVNALGKTNLLELWNPYEGMLFWVIIISHAALAGHFFRLTTTTMLASFTLRIATRNEYVEVGTRPLERLMWFEKLCVNKGASAQNLALISSNEDDGE